MEQFRTFGPATTLSGLIPPPTPLPNMYKFVLLIDFEVDGILHTVADESKLNEVQIRFLGKITNR
jgi:hypothetical protein